MVFAGTPPFAARALDAIVAAGFEVPLVLTQPDRPAGRGMRLAASAVSLAADRHGIEVAKPPSLRTEQATRMLLDVAPDVMVVAAYGLILPQAILDVPPRGCLNIHASLLPRWRGAAPVQRAILAGDATTGISIMRMDAGLDTGAVLVTQAIPIPSDATAASLTSSLADLGAAAVVDVLRRLPEFRGQPQPDAGVTYAAKITKAEARIDWTLPAEVIERQVRAFNPMPGAETSVEGHPVKIWRAAVDSGSGGPGEVMAAGASGILVACGKGALRITELQRAGSRRMEVGDWLRGVALRVGSHLASVPTVNH